MFHDQVVQFTDAGAAAGNAVVTFDTLSLVAPRGRFDVEMYMGSLKLTGQVCCSNLLLYAMQRLPVNVMATVGHPYACLVQCDCSMSSVLQFCQRTFTLKLISVLFLLSQNDHMHDMSI